MNWSTVWTVPIIKPSPQSVWLLNLREQNERESRLIKEAAKRIADEKCTTFSQAK